MSVPGEPAATTAPYVILREPDGSQRKYILAGATAWTLGRDEDNAIVLTDPSVSRQHALLQYLDNNSIYLIDLGSRNGSFVNNRRVSIPTLLQDGDHLTLGQSQLEFHSGSLASPEPSPAAKLSDTLVLQTRWLISVAVVDVRGYGQLTQQLDERLLSQVMGDWFRRGGDIIQQYGGTVDKYIGDAIMAVWFHAPQANEDPLQAEQVGIELDVKSVLRAMVKLFQMTEQLNGEFPLPSPLRLGGGRQHRLGHCAPGGQQHPPGIHRPGRYGQFGLSHRECYPHPQRRLGHQPRHLYLLGATTGTGSYLLCAAGGSAQGIYPPAPGVLLRCGGSAGRSRHLDPASR